MAFTVTFKSNKIRLQRSIFAIEIQFQWTLIGNESVQIAEAKSLEVVAMNSDSLANLSDLALTKFELLDRTLKPILLSAIAEDTFAQIIDGQPTRPSYRKNYRTVWDRGVSERTRPTDSSIREWTEIKETFVPQILRLDAQLVQAFQSSEEHSHLEDLRLLEMVAASLHFLAGAIYASFHPDTDLSPPFNPNDHRFLMTSHFWVDFYHRAFTFYEQYPYGLLNVVGYWAEAQILGGVLLFERGGSGREVSPCIGLGSTRYYGCKLILGRI